MKLSESKLWELQRNDYVSLGPRCWIDGLVPSQITSNPAIADYYATIAIETINRYPASDTPFYFLELGAGSGKFAYLFLQALLKKVPRSQIRYILSDISPHTLLFWQHHPLLHPFIEEGILECSLYDPTSSDNTLCLPPSPYPLFVIANYFFDSLPQDLYRVHNHQIEEAAVSLSDTLELSYTFIPPSPSPYTPLLQEHAHLNNTTFLLPVGALQTLDHLKKLTNNHFILLCGDKELSFTTNPTYARHTTISYPVNFYALSEYMQMHGGTAIFPTDRTPYFKTIILLSHHDPYPYQSLLDTFSPQKYVDSNPAEEGLSHFFPLSQEETFHLAEIATPAAMNLLSLCSSLPSKTTRTLQISTLSDLPPSGFFDNILFVPPKNLSKRTHQPSPLLVQEGQKKIQAIKEQYPFLQTITYSDSAIEEFFTLLPSIPLIDPLYLLRFFSELHQDQKITSSQYTTIQQKLIASKLLPQEIIDNFTQEKKAPEEPSEHTLFLTLFKHCYTHHMKQGSTFQAILSDPISLLDHPEFFDLVLTNPFLDFHSTPIPTITKH